MNDEELKKVLEAGRIGARAREAGAKLIKAGAKVLDVCEAAEKIIIEAGAFPAFPCNLSINSEAAHYSPLIGDEKVIPEGAVVKLDIGAHIDGFISDTAVTVSLEDRYEKLLDSSRDALKFAIMNSKVGANIGDIGKVIEKTIKINGFKPIRNLGGHLIKRYELHAGVFIPNVYERNAGTLQDGNTYAIEPFATDGAGMVIEGKQITIYSVRSVDEKGLNDVERKYLSEIFHRFNYLPFNERWLKDIGSADEIRSNLVSLSKKGKLYGYPVLIEAKKGIVAQFEHTIYVSKDNLIVTTDVNNS
ncbi:Methionine aminopeptidase [Sulfuracidifex tepidarius]|uniref:Methionine aminopeptidase n=1 Tax=Sulfuracidifex tepidarius TaxID=1294262 RepID=A0A510DWP3_9CREN|nr:type II methionyl aminopeptidase [Sulfuracidifex tepidarius]BBG24617.1 Methionine aminopeptidase [Sulfuracidifex tepidarius]